MDINIGRNIQEMRIYRKMDVQALAKKCKVDSSVITDWENGTVVPSATELYVISKALDVEMNYFFEEIGPKDDWYDGMDHNKLSSIMLLLTECEIVNPARRIFLKRGLKEQLAEYDLKKLDNAKFSIKNTTEKQRKNVVSVYEEFFGDEYSDIIDGYIKGEHEIIKLQDAICAKGEVHRKSEDKEKEEKTSSDVWKAYLQCIKYLETALFNEFVDLRYALVAVEKLDEFYKVVGRMEDINYIVLKYVCAELKSCCENDDVEGVRRIYIFLNNYGEALWSQL